MLDCVTQCSQSAAHCVSSSYRSNRLGLLHWDPYNWMALKAIFCFLKIKFNFNRIKSATKFLYVKTSGAKL